MKLMLIRHYQVYEIKKRKHRLKAGHPMKHFIDDSNYEATSIRISNKPIINEKVRILVKSIGDIEKFKEHIHTANDILHKEVEIYVSYWDFSEIDKTPNLSLIGIIASYFELPKDFLENKSQRLGYVIPRQIYQYILTQTYQYKYYHLFKQYRLLPGWTPANQLYSVRLIKNIKHYPCGGQYQYIRRDTANIIKIIRSLSKPVLLV